MKRTIILIMMLVLLSGLVHADFEEIHNDWHEYRDSWTIGTDAYSIALDPSNDNKILFRSNTFSWIINVEDCTTSGGYEYCYANVSYDVDEATISDNGKFVPGIQIIVSKEETDISDVDFSHAFATSDKELHTLTIKMKNNEPAWVNPISYEIIVPEGVTLKNFKDFTLVGKTLKLITSLKPDLTREYIIEFETQGFQKFVFDYSASYELNTVQKEKSGTASIEIAGPYSFSGALSPEKMDIMETSSLTFTIENKKSTDTLEITEFTITVPTSLVYTPKENLKSSARGKFISTENSVAESVTESFKLNIKGDRTGTYLISALIKMEMDGETFEETFNKTLTIIAEGVKSDFYLNKDDVLAGSEVQLVYAIANENENLNFNNINVSISSDFFSDSFVLERLEKSSVMNTVYQKDIVVPLIPNDETFTIEAKATYRTKTGEELELEKVIELKVTGTGEILKIEQDVKQSLVNPGEEITVEVYVENLKDEKFTQVNALEEFSRGAEVTFGNPFKTFNLEPKENQKVYTYKVKLPEKYFWDTFNITSTVVISNLGYKTQALTTVSVNATEEVVVIAEKADVESAPKDVVEIDVKIGDTGSKKQSFLIKVVKAIENFFVGLFT